MIVVIIQVYLKKGVKLINNLWFIDKCDSKHCDLAVAPLCVGTGGLLNST